MPTLPLGSVAGGNYTAPPVDWTALSVTAGTGRYLNGQDTRNMVADIVYESGNMFVIMAEQHAGTDTYGLWYNSDPVNSPTGWTRRNPLGGTTAQQCTIVSRNSSQGRWYFGGQSWLVTSTTLTGTTSNTTPNTTYEGNYGNNYVPTGIAHNGSRTVVCYRGSAGPQAGSIGTIYTTDDGLNFTQRTSWAGYQYNDVCYAGNNTFVGVGASHIVSRSTDNGVNWGGIQLTNEGYGPTDIVKVAANGTGTVVARGIYALWTSTNYGATWSKTYTDNPATSANYTRNAPGNAYPNSFPATLEWNSTLGRFVAMFGAVQLTSTNGSTWTQNTKFSFANTGIFIGAMAYHPIMNYWVAVQCKSSTDQYSTGVAKALAWTDNITGV